MVLTNISRTGRSATVKRNAKSPSPPPLELDQQPEDERQGSNGLVIPNRNDVSNFMEDEEEEGEELDMEGLKKEEDDSLSLLIDSRLLHKDFIVDKFSLALVYFRKVLGLACSCYIVIVWSLEAINMPRGGLHS